MNKIIFPLITEEDKKLPFYVKSVGGKTIQEHILREHGYGDYHWLHCINGRGKLIVENKEYIIKENMGFFFYPGVPHEYFALDKVWQTRWITFDGYAVSSLMKIVGLEKVGVYYVYDIHNLEDILNDICLKAQSKSSIKGFECSALLYRFLLQVKSCITTGDVKTRTLSYKQLQPVISYIEKFYNLPISLEEMAAQINISPQHLCRLFKQTFGITPFTYLTKLRIQKAKEFIIADTKLRIKDIASKVGYNDTSYFCLIFKEYEGATPMEFRKMYGG